ncbi:hypothetical protein, partial [Robinsoniella peoriensis]|uniref:hypothetical protein n=1 Tax=Robinsoniella peoriensis TaxID=180332 RepID=UPI001A9A3664
MKVCYFFWIEETNHSAKFSCFMLFVFSMIDALGLKLFVLYLMERSIFLAVYAQKKIKAYFFSDHKKKNKSRSQNQLLDIIAYTNRVRHATTPGFHHAEKTSFVSTNAISEREGGGPGHWFGRRIAELSIYLPYRSAFWR